jgi:two-component SAPR family response regulator
LILRIPLIDEKIILPISENMSRRSQLYCTSIFFFLLIFTQCAFSQSYGLGFYSHDKVAEQRTSLELFQDIGYSPSGNFEIQFELSFLPYHEDYYGYLFRFIADGKTNFDLVYNKRDSNPDIPGKDNRHFKLIINDRFTNIAFHLDQQTLINQWSTFKLVFDAVRSSVVLYVDNRPYVENNVRLDKASVYRFLWGMNNFGNFKTSDCPPFKVRNIKISAGQETKYFWPLNEMSGNIAYEMINHADARVDNPLWIRSLHYKWSPLPDIKVDGAASVAYSARNNTIYIVGSDALWSYSLKGMSWIRTPYVSGKFNLYPSNESVFDDSTGILYNYYIDKLHKKISAYDFRTNSWKNDTLISVQSKDYWQTNHFISASDSALYVIGGYGQLTYKNSVMKYNLLSRQWTTLKTNGDHFCPRYLSAAGSPDNGKIVYILGGYGSLKGEQVLNPSNLYNFFSFDTRTGTFHKIYELKHDGEDFAFANNMYIDAVKRTYHALIFPNYRYNSHLKLITGSLDRPRYQVVGDSIPFSFHDTHAFATLYFSKEYQKLITVTLLRDEPTNQTSVHLFSLYYPAVDMEYRTGVDLNAKNRALPRKIISWALSIVVVSVAGGLLLRRARKKQAGYPDPQIAQVSGAVDITLSKNMPCDIEVASERKKNAIYCFGDLQFLDANGDNVTKKLSPLLKELFLVVLIFSLRNGRGVSPDKLLELLWQDKSDGDARNNRSANLSKLKIMLSEVGNIEVSKETGNYKIIIDHESIYCDYYEYQLIMAAGKILSKDVMIRLISIVQRGAFLPNTEYAWLDVVKSDISNQIVDFFIENMDRLSIEKDAELITKAANCVFFFDSVNEEAMTAKCKALAYLGKHSLAKSNFENFQREYKRLYNENFKKTFNEVLGGPHERPIDV